MKRVYLVIGIVMLVLFMNIVANQMFNTEQIKKNKDGILANKSQWTEMIARDVNKGKLSVVADGVIYDDPDTMYMNEDMELMVSVDEISDFFDCAEDLYDNNVLCIQKGGTKVEIDLNTQEYIVDGEEGSGTFAIDNSNDTLFVPASIFTECFGYEYEWDGAKNTATLICKNPEERNLPYYYSYVDENKAPAIRMQGNYGTCWAFAALTALETSLLPEENMVFSVDHMVLCDSFPEGMNDGGDYSMSNAYLAAWQGPVLEKDDPYDGESEDTLKAVKHVQEIQILEPNNFQKIKEMVYKYGGVQSSLYTSLINSQSISSYYNKETYAYCYMGENKPNHDVVIIGWDDNYPKENFNAEVEGNGAFICRSSWGEEFGDRGNFYVSYYDSNIGVHNVVFTDVQDSDNYDKIYQTDLCGWVGNMGYKDENTAYFANVYTATSRETLEAVSFYATDVDTSYEVYVVSDFVDANSLTSGRRLEASGVLPSQGYYTIDLNESIELRKNQKFAVVVKATTPNSTKPIPVEYASEERGENVVIDDGEGYMSLRGNSWENTEKSKSCNICLKAFTKKKD